MTNCQDCAEKDRRIAELEADSVKLQRHRDHWRGYAYGTRGKPSDFLDGDMVERPWTLLEANALKLSNAEAEITRLTAELAEANRKLELMPALVDGCRLTAIDRAREESA
jgi:hypothetical protein